MLNITNCQRNANHNYNEVSLHTSQNSFKKSTNNKRGEDVEKKYNTLTLFSSVQSLSRVWLFETAQSATCQASLSIINSQSLLKLMSIESVMPSNHLILLSPSPLTFTLSQHQNLPMSQLFISGGQSIVVSASASVLAMNIQDWSPLGWTDWISLLSKGLSRVFSNTTVQKHQFLGTQLSLESNS